ncbi:MAG: methyltransferase domain-containing protein [Sedimentisphaerales bacterium]|nr:methyltransferase domain-containing protein [Sedimentisphaerales bacterium]
MGRELSKSARSVALEVLSRTDPERDYAGPILDSLLDQTTERQRATDLVFGTIRNCGAIDTVITAFSSRPAERISAELLNIIRIAVYELIYRPQTADYSIVNEAVENAKARAGEKQAGFVNAVLRNITRRIANRQIALADADIKAALPQTPSTGCVFNTSFMPAPESSPADYLSTAFSLPIWLIADWLEEFGFEIACNICFASNRRPSVYLRPNRLKTTAQELAKKLQQGDIDFEIVPAHLSQRPSIENRASNAGNQALSMIRLKSASAITQLPGFADGLFSVQDLAASRAVMMFDPQPGWKVLDLCAAPGVKTTQLAELTGDSAHIVATDVNRDRLRRIEENATRLGIASIEIVGYEDIDVRLAALAPFDSVLLDVPCSNTGVLAKRVEARYRLKPAVIEHFAATQSRLLGTAASMLKPNGKICYSTCSILRMENSEVIREFLRRNDGLRLELEELILPTAGTCIQSPSCEKSFDEFDHDGGYVAIITRG